MCTAATYQAKDFYFGRTLDYDFSYGEEVTIMPRRYGFPFRHMGNMTNHYAMIGMAHVADGCPLYYDAVNEKGLCMAGLNFVGNAQYQTLRPDKDNVASFELIPWILGQCATVREAKGILESMNLTNTPFHATLPLAWLHWMLADRNEAVTIEFREDGMHIFPNPVGVLTNNPPFEMQMSQLNHYMALSNKTPQNRFSDQLPLYADSRGMGALGLPGDLSSQSRFVRAAFVKMNSVLKDSREEGVNQFFHILGSVEQQRGCCEVGDGKYEITIYTSCCNADRGIYYYTTYGNHQITAVSMHHENLDGSRLFRYPLTQSEQIRMQNEQNA